MNIPDKFTIEFKLRPSDGWGGESWHVRSDEIPKLMYWRGKLHEALKDLCEEMTDIVMHK